MPGEPIYRKPELYRGEPEFTDSISGKLDPTSLRAWISKMDIYFRLAAADQSDEERFDHATKYLRGTARNFAKEYAHGNEPRTWSAFKEALRKRFMPANYKQLVQHEFFSIKQTTTVAEYTHRYRILTMCLPSEYKNERILMDKYIEGLRPRVKAKVDMSFPKTLDDAMYSAAVFDTYAS